MLKLQSFVNFKLYHCIKRIVPALFYSVSVAADIGLLSSSFFAISTIDVFVEELVFGQLLLGLSNELVSIVVDEDGFPVFVFEHNLIKLQIISVIDLVFLKLLPLQL